MPDAESITSAVAVFQQSYKPFRGEFFDLYDDEICKDEDQSIRAWNQVAVGILFRLERIYQALVEKWWMSLSSFAMRSQLALTMRSRECLVENLLQQFNDSQRSPLDRYDSAKLLLQRLQADPRDFAAAPEMTDHQRHELLLECVGQDELDGVRLDAMWMAEGFHLQFVEAVNRIPHINRPADLDGLGSEIRALCLPSRGFSILDLLNQLGWLFDPDHEFRNRFRELVGEHNDQTEWVAPLLERVAEIQNDRVREMVKSIAKRRVTLQGKTAAESLELQPA